MKTIETDKIVKLIDFYEELQGHDIKYRDKCKQSRVLQKNVRFANGKISTFQLVIKELKELI